MGEVGAFERITQNRVVKLFEQQLEYRYLGNWQDNPNNKYLCKINCILTPKVS